MDIIELGDKQIQKFVCNETSYFALNIIDIGTQEVIYANNAMKKIMVDVDEKKCYKSIYGQNTTCDWCKVKDMIESPQKQQQSLFEYEHFNEFANKWYQIQSKVTKLEGGRDVLISFMLDISSQKAAQGELINTQVELTQQAEQLKQAQKELEKLASIDSMTKLYNRRYFVEFSTSILELTKRRKEDLSLIMLDIDDFKKVNDTYGHQVGDQVIITLANKLMQIQRKSDVVCRYGGEEFVILLPHTSIQNAHIVAEKLRQRVASNIIDSGEINNLKFTISLGVSTVDIKNDCNIEQALKRADDALYRAKESGKNRVCD